MLLAAALVAVVAGRPAGLQPTTATLAQIIRQHEAAVGSGAALEPWRRESWSIEDRGARASETLWRHGLDYRSTIARGPLVEEYGRLGETAWHKTLNGTVYETTSPDLESFLMMRFVDDAADAKNDVEVLGETPAPGAAYVLEVRKPFTTSSEWVWYGKDTGLVSRVERAAGDRRFVESFDDYRAVHGVVEPWHIHDTAQPSGLERDYRRTSLEFGGAADPSFFAKPPPELRRAAFSRDGALPCRFTRRAVLLRLFVRGRGLDFELAMAAPGSLIDWKVARDLNLPDFGQPTERASHPLPFDTELPDAKLGDAGALDGFRLRAVSFSYVADPGTKVVGVLGADFFQGASLKIDYARGRVELVTQAAIDTAAAGSEAHVVPLRFDDGLPFTAGRIGGAAADTIVLDDRLITSLVLAPFSLNHPEIVPDFRTGKARTMAPFADAATYGVEVDAWRSVVPSVTVSSVFVGGLQVLATNASSPFGRDVDAAVGSDVLRYFDVYPDFKASRLVLVPNQTYRQTFSLPPAPR